MISPKEFPAIDEFRALSNYSSIGFGLNKNESYVIKDTHEAAYDLANRLLYQLNLTYSQEKFNAPVEISQGYWSFPQHYVGNSLRLTVTDFSKRAVGCNLNPLSYHRPPREISFPDVLKFANCRELSVNRCTLACDNPQLLDNFDQQNPKVKGIIQEGPIISYLQNHLREHLGLQHITIERDQMTYSNPSYRILSCKVDGIINIHGRRQGCLEVKTYWGTTQLDFLVSGEQENQRFCLNQNHKYWYQIQAYLHIMNLSFGVMAVYLGQVDQLLMIPVRKDTHRFNDVYRQMCSRYLTELFMPKFASSEERLKEISYKLSPQLLQNMTDFLTTPAPSSNAQFYLQAHREYFASRRMETLPKALKYYS